MTESIINKMRTFCDEFEKEAKKNPRMYDEDDFSDAYYAIEDMSRTTEKRAFWFGQYQTVCERLHSLCVGSNADLLGSNYCEVMSMKFKRPLVEGHPTVEFLRDETSILSEYIGHIEDNRLYDYSAGDLKGILRSLFANWVDDLEKKMEFIIGICDVLCDDSSPGYQKSVMKQLKQLTRVSGKFYEEEEEEED